MTEAMDATGGMAKVLTHFSDPYVRQARLVPALLTIAPAGTLVIALYHDDLSVISSIVSFLMTCGLLFLLSDMARRLGKAKEKVLWSAWGGLPSMQVLRHRDTTFDVVSTERYHATLAKKMRRVFPTRDDEKNDSASADAMYTSASNMLRDATRDTKTFHLIFANNISYGFRRNGLGLRGVGITVCVACILWVLVRHGWHYWVKQVHDTHNLETFFNQGEWVTLGVSGLMLLVWLLYFNRETVKEAAFTYAKSLVDACERVT